MKSPACYISCHLKKEIRVGARVLLVAGDATESLDTWYPYHRMRQEGIEVHIGAPTKKVLNSVIHDFEPGWDTYVEKPLYRIPADVAFKDVLPENYGRFYRARS